MIKKFTLALLTMVTISCSPDDPVSLAFTPPECTITSTTDFSEGKYGHLVKSYTVKNTGKPTAFHVQLKVKLKSGNHIVEEDVGIFGTLNSGESRTEELLFDVDRSEFTIEETELAWLDAESRYHEK